MSLRKILGECGNTSVTHESYPSEWYKAGPRIGELILKLKGSSDTLLGDVSCGHLPHINRIRDAIPDLPVICLHRNKNEVVESFMNNMPPLLRPEDRRCRMNMLEMNGWNPDKVLRWPVIDAATSKQAWEFYWEYAEELMRMVKEPVEHVWMKSLNDDFCVNRVYDFLDIPLVDRVLPHRRKWNSTKERKCG
jgi:hypothetical protein